METLLKVCFLDVFS